MTKKKVIRNFGLKMDIFSGKNRHSEILVGEKFFRPPPNSAPGLRRWMGVIEEMICCFSLKGRGSQTISDDYAESEYGCFRMLLEDGQRIRGTTGRRFQRHDLLLTSMLLLLLLLLLLLMVVVVVLLLLMVVVVVVLLLLVV